MICGADMHAISHRVIRLQGVEYWMRFMGVFGIVKRSWVA